MVARRTQTFYTTLAAVVLGFGSASFALNNGVARTPPMGFNPYNSLFIVTEQQRTMLADAMVESGLFAAGWNYVNEDVGGLNSKMINPSGAKAVCDYVHSKGLKIGMYTFPPRDGVTSNPGITTMATNIKNWGVDYLKYDGWSETPASAFTEMRDALAATGRPVCFSVNGAQGATICNMWRTSGDIDPDWNAWTGCLNTNAGGTSVPGGWGDPDMLEIQCGMASFAEEVAMFSLWCVTSSPLITGTDFRSMFLSTQYIVLNTEAIAVNQDTAFSVNSSYGGSGKRIKTVGTGEIWMKTVTGGAKAVVLFNKGTAAASMTVNWTDIGVPAGVAQVRDLWEHRNLGPSTDSYTAQVPSHGCKFLKIVAGSVPIPEPPATWSAKPPDPIAVTPLPTTGWRGTTDVTGWSDISALVDGNLGTIPSEIQNYQTSNFVAFDMGAAKTFNCVILNNSIVKVGAVLKPYRVYNSVHLWKLFVSDNGTTWRGPIDSTWNGPLNYALFAFTSQTARHIRITHDLVNCHLTNYEYAGDEIKFGFSEGMLSEIQVANSAQFPVRVRPAADPSDFAVAPEAKAMPRRLVVLGTDRTSGLPSLLPSMGTAVFAVDGRRVGGLRDISEQMPCIGIFVPDGRQ